MRRKLVKLESERGLQAVLELIADMGPGKARAGVLGVGAVHTANWALYQIGYSEVAVLFPEDWDGAPFPFELDTDGFAKLFESLHRVQRLCTWDATEARFQSNARRWLRNMLRHVPNARNVVAW